MAEIKQLKGLQIGNEIYSQIDDEDTDEELTWSSQKIFNDAYEEIRQPSSNPTITQVEVASGATIQFKIIQDETLQIQIPNSIAEWTSEDFPSDSSSSNGRYFKDETTESERKFSLVGSKGWATYPRITTTGAAIKVENTPGLAIPKIINNYGEIQQATTLNFSKNNNIDVFTTAGGINPIMVEATTGLIKEIHYVKTTSTGEKFPLPLTLQSETVQLYISVCKDWAIKQQQIIFEWGALPDEIYTFTNPYSKPVLLSNINAEFQTTTKTPKEIHNELREHIGNLRTQIDNQNEELRTQMDNQNKELRTQMRTQKEGLDASIGELGDSIEGLSDSINSLDSRISTLIKDPVNIDEITESDCSSETTWSSATLYTLFNQLWDQIITLTTKIDALTPDTEPDQQEPTT